MVTADDIARAQAAVADVGRHTPILPSATLSDRTGETLDVRDEDTQRLLERA